MEMKCRLARVWRSRTVPLQWQSPDIPPVDSARGRHWDLPLKSSLLSLKLEPGVNKVLNHLPPRKIATSEWSLLDKLAVQLLNSKAFGSIYRFIYLFIAPRLRVKREPPQLFKSLTANTHMWLRSRGSDEALFWPLKASGSCIGHKCTQVQAKICTHKINKYLRKKWNPFRNVGCFFLSIIIPVYSVLGTHTRVLFFFLNSFFYH